MRRWDRVKALFHACQELDPPARAARLDAECAGDAELRAEVEGLLRAQAQPARIFARDGSALLDALLDDGVKPEDFAGRRIGSYRVLRLLGEGGMGQVFLAEREGGDFAQRVALKRIRADFAGAETRLRFLREREILARLAHPNVAQLHDGGVADDGTPYFTLEYVDGEPITRWCDARKLDVRERLALVLQVCAAVAYAHRNLVVHRDLKPSNILVTNDGVVKLLDFGIAKLLESDPAAGLTGTAASVMTREYAAPEQVLGEPITTATDVYALGVLAYELLSGHLPYPRAENGETSYPKAIVEHAPEPLPLAVRRKSAEADDKRSPASIASARATTPDVLQRALRGDLDRVVRHALEKSPEARYATVGAFADDLRAVLDEQPIAGSARAARLKLFVRRHWLPVAAGAVALLAVVAGAGAIAFEARERERAAERALRESETTAAVKDFLLSLFAGADPRANDGKTLTVRDLLDKGAKHIDEDLGSEPELKAELEGALGGVYSRLGLYPQAIALQEQSIKGLDAAGGNAKLAALTVLDLATTVRSSGDSTRAHALLDETVRRFEALPGPPDEKLVRALYLRTFVFINAHDFDKALADAARAESIARNYPKQPDLLGDALHAKASAQWGVHAYREAEAELREAIDKHRAAGAKAALSVGSDQQTLALIYSETGRYREALALNEDVLSHARAVMGDRHPYVAHIKVSTAGDLRHLGRYAEAERRLRDAYETQQPLLGPDSTYLAETQNALATVLVQEHRYDDAETAYAAARAIWEKRYGEKFSYVIGVRGDLAFVALARGDASRAESDLRAVLDDRASAHDEDVSIEEARYAEAERRNGHEAAALASARSALAHAVAIHGETSWESALVHRYLGLALADAGDTGGAAQNLRLAIAYYDGLAGGGDHPLAATTRLLLACVLARRPATHAEAIALAERAAASRERLFGASDAGTKEARDALAELRAGRSKLPPVAFALADP
jgi:serine/threonine-protein kinase